MLYISPVISEEEEKEIFGFMAELKDKLVIEKAKKTIKRLFPQASFKNCTITYNSIGKMPLEVKKIIRQGILDHLSKIDCDFETYQSWLSETQLVENKEIAAIWSLFYKIKFSEEVKNVLRSLEDSAIETALKQIAKQLV